MKHNLNCNSILTSSNPGHLIINYDLWTYDITQLHECTILHSVHLLKCFRSFYSQLFYVFFPLNPVSVVKFWPFFFPEIYSPTSTQASRKSFLASFCSSESSIKSISVERIDCKNIFFVLMFILFQWAAQITQKSHASVHQNAPHVHKYACFCVPTLIKICWQEWTFQSHMAPLSGIPILPLTRTALNKICENDCFSILYAKICGRFSYDCYSIAIMCIKVKLSKRILDFFDEIYSVSVC